MQAGDRAWQRFQVRVAWHPMVAAPESPGDTIPMSTPTSPRPYPRLLADVGGTNVRLAVQGEVDGPLLHVGSYACASFPGLLEAIGHHLAVEALECPRWGAFGIATAITGDVVRMTNHPWSFSILALQASLGMNQLMVLNDFSALAMSLPALGEAERWQIGGGSPIARAPMALIGPGTGLGVSGLVPALSGAGMVPIAGEGGHVTLSSFNSEERAVLEVLHCRFGHASAERALSGPGLENLYAALGQVRGARARELAAHAVTAAAQASSDPLAKDTLDLFSSLLGNVAGNLALTLGARGGVYVGGGIVQRLGRQFNAARFRQSFEAKGRFREFLCQIPSFIILSTEQAALKGASLALDAGLAR